LAGLKKRLESIAPARRRTIADFLVAVAGSDGRISKQEVAALAKVYCLLGLPPEDVYGHIHAFTATAAAGATPPVPPPAAAPVVVRPASERASGHRIPSPPAPESGTGSPVGTVPAAGFRLDMALVNARLSESRAVSALLSQVFTEEEEARPAAPAAVAGESLFPGLDGPHSAVLRELIRKTSWPRADLDALCGCHRLLPDGAIETINDAVMDRHDALLIEGDDPLDVNPDLAREIVP
jgi:hypothetical protein